MYKIIIVILKIYVKLLPISLYGKFIYFMIKLKKFAIIINNFEKFFKTKID